MRIRHCVPRLDPRHGGPSQTVVALTDALARMGRLAMELLAQGAAGRPVITTRGAPWADLETHRCGWWIGTGVAPLVEALRAATALSDIERQAMGERGRVYVQRYDWDLIARQTLALYRWVLGQGERPGFVRVD
jgi:glycosyltransferase involved in cell wall biosynthesis